MKNSMENSGADTAHFINARESQEKNGNGKNGMHLPLILKPEGKGKLSKRDGDKMGFPVFPLTWKGSKGFKERGFLPEALINYLVLLGWNPGTQQEIFDIETLKEVFDTNKLQTGGAKFNFEKAKWINHKFLGLTEPKIIFERFPEFTECLPRSWSKIKKNFVYSLLRDRLFLLEDLKIQSQLFLSNPQTYDDRVVRRIQKHNPSKILDQFANLANNGIPIDTWKSKIQEWNEKEQLPIGSILQTLRLAIVGNLSGPDIFQICEVLGNEITLMRLEKLKNHLN